MIHEEEVEQCPDTHLEVYVYLTLGDLPGVHYHAQSFKFQVPGPEYMLIASHRIPKSTFNKDAAVAQAVSDIDQLIQEAYVDAECIVTKLKARKANLLALEYSNA